MLRESSGYLDPIDGVLVRGWAVPDDPRTAASVDILIDGTLVARVPADSYRGDLDEEGIQQGFAAFFYELPLSFRDGAVHELDARHSGTDQSLDDAPARFRITPKGHATLDDRRRWAARQLSYEGATGARLADSLRRTRKLAVFATYHEAPRHLRYHRDIMQGLADAGFTVLVVHAADTHRPGLAQTDAPDRFTILKRNVGYDFGSYAVGVFATCDHFDRLDEMVLINDSIVQFSGALSQLIARLRATGAEAASCTDSFEHCYHLQSYMIWFDARILRSGCLQRFMANYSFTSKKEDVIAEGELGLSRMLQSEGFRLAALYPYHAVAAAWIAQSPASMQAIRDLPGLPADWPGGAYKKALLERFDLIMERLLHGTPLNPSHFFWDTLVDTFGCPFIKRELILVNPCNVPSYFRLGRHFPVNSSAFETLTELRNCYGGHLVAPAIENPDRQASELDRASDPPSDGGERALRLIQNADQQELMLRLGHRDTT